MTVVAELANAGIGFLAGVGVTVCYYRALGYRVKAEHR